MGLCVFALYSVVADWHSPARVASAYTHAGQLFRVERALHLDVERGLNSWLAPRILLRTLANYEYAITYIISAFLLLGWLYARRPGTYRWARSSFVVLNLLGILCFAVYPVAPPRLLPQLGFHDTVAQGHTWGSWGSPLVAHANDLAAMPSLHLAWALWVSVVLASISGRWLTQLLSLAHVLVTTFVILATANHFLLDAVGGVVFVAVSVRLTSIVTDHPRTVARRGPRVAAADVFFLHVESAAAPQHVGGLVLLDWHGRSGGAPTRADVARLIGAQLPFLPRFRQTVSPPTRWRRARWTTVGELDWDWHVVERDICTPTGEFGGRRALDALVAEYQSTLLPRDRPLWRMIVVHGVGPEQSAAVLIVHHVVADGFGTVAQALRLLEPPLPPREPTVAPPGALSSAAAIVVGLAQLATDGRTRQRLTGSATAPPRVRLRHRAARRRPHRGPRARHTGQRRPAERRRRWPGPIRPIAAAGTAHIRAVDGPRPRGRHRGQRHRSRDDRPTAGADGRGRAPVHGSPGQRSPAPAHARPRLAFRDERRRGGDASARARLVRQDRLRMAVLPGDRVEHARA